MEAAKEVKEIHDKFEPIEGIDKTTQLEALYSQNPNLLPSLDSNQNKRIQSPLSYR